MCHALPLTIKKACAPAYSGSDLSDPERQELAYEQSSTSSVRAWDYSRTRFTGSTQSANVYPDARALSPPFVKFLDDLYDRQDVLGNCLLRAFADMFSLPANTFQQHFEKGDFG